MMPYKVFTYKLVSYHLARVAAESGESRNATGTGVDIVVDAVVPVAVGAPGGERAIGGRELGATTFEEEHTVNHPNLYLQNRNFYLLPSAYSQLMPPAMQVRSPWQSSPLMTQARVSSSARVSTCSWPSRAIRSELGPGAAMASPRNRITEVRTLVDSILAVVMFLRVEDCEMNEWVNNWLEERVMSELMSNSEKFLWFRGVPGGSYTRDDHRWIDMEVSICLLVTAHDCDYPDGAAYLWIGRYTAMPQSAPWDSKEVEQICQESKSWA